jgi:tRNA(fMet)-specific endonuclease VapC
LGTLIDSSILIAAERGRLDLDATLADRKDEQLRLAAITVAELYEGVERADTPARAGTRRSLIEGYITRMPVVAFDAEIAREYARMRVKLMPVGKTIAVHDLQIAVTALVIGYQVATRDMRSFPRIPGLRFEQW